MIKCIIVEDDIMSMSALKRLCEKINVIQLVGAFSTVNEAVLFLNADSNVDLIFLDIELGDMTGFQVLDQIPFLPEIIITSFKEKYAFEAFQYEACHYLKKPVKLTEFRIAVQKVTDKLALQKIDHVGDNIYIKSNAEYVNLAVEEILYIENIGDYVKFCLSEKSYVTHGTLKNLAKKLPSDIFMRVHRTFIVNLKHIKNIKDNSLLVGRKIIPVSKANKPVLMQKINLI